MDNFKENLRNRELVNIYSSLLTKTQQEVLEDYFCYDLSLGEIASNRDVSRSAVEDAIKKGLKKIEGFEQELRIYEKRLKVLEITAKMRSKSENLEEIEQLERVVK